MAENNCIKMLLLRGVVFVLFIGLALTDAKSFAANVNVKVPSTPSDGTDGRIVGGNTAERNQFPYQASFRYHSDFVHFCGGVIIGIHWVLTAQHCLVYYYNTPDVFLVAVGAHAMRNDAILYQVTRVVMHANYSAELITNDIALVQTRMPIVMMPGRVAPIAFSAKHIGANVAVRSSGWGDTSLFGNGPEYLQYLDLVTLTNIDCRSRHAKLSESVTDDNICAFSNAHGRGMCHADSGGPLVAGDQLVGLVSWGEPCAVGRPDAFVRISYFFDWIVETMRTEMN